MKFANPDEQWAFKCHGHMSDDQIRGEINRLKYGRANLRQENSGQYSNYYAPAIHYLEVELNRRASVGESDD